MNKELFKQARKDYSNGNYVAALDGFIACSQELDGLSNSDLCMFYHLLGNCYIKNGKAKHASKSYQKALTFDPGSRRSPLCVNLGTALLSTQDYNGAIEAFQMALEDEEYASAYKAYSGIGTAQLKLHNMLEAGEAFREAAVDESNPNPEKSLVNLGVCFMELKRPADAVTSYNAALELGIDGTMRTKTLSNLGQAYVASGELQKAKEAFEEALEDPNYELNELAIHDYQITNTLLEKYANVFENENDYFEQQRRKAAQLAADQTGEIDIVNSTIDDTDKSKAIDDVNTGAFDTTNGDDALAAGVAGVAGVVAGAAGGAVAAGAMQNAYADPMNGVYQSQGEPTLTGYAQATNAANDYYQSNGYQDNTQVFPQEQNYSQTPYSDEEMWQASNIENTGDIPSLNNTNFFDVSEGDIMQQAMLEKKNKPKSKGRKVLKVILIILIILVLLAAAGAAAAYFLGYGWPLQEAVVSQSVEDALAQRDLTNSFTSDVGKEQRQEQVDLLTDVKSYDIVAVDRTRDKSTVYIKAQLKSGGTMYYKVTLVRDITSFKISNISLYFPNKSLE
ncbi:MAG: tetratricopeptide repeat protein [Coriobacteriales bacterium]|nr:tetratricopeptide repeat protein [Coriobacteriales bacterium]